MSSTRIGYPSESLDRQFLADLASVSAWRLEGGNMRMDLTGGRTMEFTVAIR
jgi:hypothetical protein